MGGFLGVLQKAGQAVKGVANTAAQQGKSDGGGDSAGTKHRDYQPVLGSKKRGGKIKKTGAYQLHKGEKVLTKKQAKKY